MLRHASIVVSPEGVPMASLRDVARVAGVSLATASRALAQPERVTTERRARVERAAAELGYRSARAGVAPIGPGRLIGQQQPDHPARTDRGDAGAVSYT